MTYSKNDLGAIDATTVAIAAQPGSGTLVVNPVSGAITYTSTHAATFSGVDTFSYRFTDKYGTASEIATVTITLTEYNQRPVAFDIMASTLKNVPVSIDVLAGTFDPDGDVDMTDVQIVQAPYNADDIFGPSPGTAVFDTATSKVIFTPAANFEGDAKFNFRVRDTRGVSSLTHVVTIQVGGVLILPPIAVNDAPESKDGNAIVIPILANDTFSSPLDPTTVSIFFEDQASPNPPTGQLVLDNDEGMVVFDPATQLATFTPKASVGATFDFRYIVQDVEGRISNTATVTIIINKAPTAHNVSTEDDENTERDESDENATLLEDSFTTLALIEDHTEDGDGTVVPSSLTIAAHPQNGILTIDPDTFVVTYFPLPNYSGPDSFVYFVRDDDGLRSQDGTVILQVNAVPDAPIANPDIGRTNMNTPVELNVALNDIEPDGQSSPLAVSLPVGFGPAHGSVSVDVATGIVTYTPDTGYVGGDAFSYFVADNDGSISNRGIVNLRVGTPVSSISGVVYVDINNNGMQDSGEIPLRETQINVEVTGDGFSLTQYMRTDANGRFEFVDSVATGLILPEGDYTISEVQPVVFSDGLDSPGTATPTLIENDRFSGISLASGDVVSGILFGESSAITAFSRFGNFGKCNESEWACQRGA